MKKKPAASIVIPLYNNEILIEKSIYSCLNQTLKNIEIIVVDDKSTDNSLKIVRRISAEDERIKVIELQKNNGTFNARRKGVQYALAELIIFLDSDDQLVNKACEIIYNNWQESSPDIINFNVIKYKDDRETGMMCNNLLYGKNGVANLDICRDHKYRLGTPGKAFSINALNKSYCFLDIDESKRLVYGEDVLLIYGVFLFAKKYINIEDYLYLYRINQYSISNIKSKSIDFLKSEQILWIINKINESKFIDEPSCNNSRDIKFRVINSLNADLHYIQRASVKNYLKFLLNGINYHFGKKILVRLFIFVITFGVVRV